MNRELLNRLRAVTPEEEELLRDRSDIDRARYMSGSGNVINSKKMLEAGRLISVQPHTRFVHFPEHTHDYVEMVYMCSGSCRHLINGTPITLKAGELLMLSQNAKQEILPASMDDIAVNFMILPQFFEATFPLLDGKETPLRTFLKDCLLGRRSSGYLHFAVADVLPVQNLLENLIWMLTGDMKYKRSTIRITMGLLFLHLLSGTEHLIDSSGSGFELAVLDYIEDHYENGSLSELSQLTGISFHRLSKKIRRELGKTYTELVQEKRLSQAAFLLKNTAASAADIAAAVGYENTSYFHRLWKQKYGISPAEYRKGK